MENLNMCDSGNNTDLIRLLIVDDHPVVRDGLRTMFMRSNIEIVGEAVDGLNAIELARDLNPDVILMDVRMPDMDGLVATRLIKEENSNVVIIMLTSFQSSDYLAEAVEAGAAGYLLKGMERAKLLSAIGDVVAGCTLFDPIELVSILREMKKAPDPLDAVVESLTEREEEVLSLVSAGKTNGAIAEDLGFSISTVKKTVQDIISKFGVSDRTQAAVMAARQGWNSKDRIEQS